MQDIYDRLGQQGFSSGASALIMNSWRPATQSAYNVYIKKWKAFARKSRVDPLHPSSAEVGNFLAELFEAGGGYSVLNTARSALSSFLPSDSGVTMGSNKDICRLVKGAFEERPSLPKHVDIWDVGVVLNYLASLPEIDQLTFKQLTLRTVMLLALVTGQRGHALYQLKLSDVKLSSTRCCLSYSAKHKHTRPGVHTSPADIRSFSEDKKLCPVEHLRAYLSRTEKLRPQACDSLFISLSKPHAPISRATFSRWIKTVLLAAGIDCASFGSHSTRAASVSAASGAGVPVQLILKAAGWSGENTFLRFYNRPVVTENFGQSVLDKFVVKK